MNAAIARHLNVTESAIVRVEEWANVIFAVVKGIGARFVSKKVVKVQEVKIGRFTIKVILDGKRKKLDVNGKIVEFSQFALTCCDLKQSQVDAVWYDLCKMAGRNVTGATTETAKSIPAKRINPDWINYNNVVNEGGEGYNPHAKYGR